jgi:hypothetical protein
MTILNPHELVLPEPVIDPLNAMFTMCLGAPWLVAERYRNGLKSLIEDCSDGDQIKTLQYVLANLRYCKSEDLLIGSIDAADAIQNAWKLEPENTILVGMAEPNKLCGSFPYVRAIETQLPRTWGGSIYPNFVSAFRHRDGRKNLIIVDDFIGTGSKVMDKLSRLRSNPKTSSYDFYVVSFAGMDRGLTSVADNVNNNMHIVMSTCLSSAKPSELSARMCASMERLEKKIFEKPGSCSLGYHKSEAAFYLEGFNIPNNTFPILWWEKYVNERERPTLFRRR